MSYTLFDPSNATDLAKFQGTLSGTLAGNATYVGVGCAPTSIYNQAGFYAMQDSDTGYIHLQKLHDDSLYTKQWYDQSTGTIFDFTNGGQGVVSTRPSNSSSSTSLTADQIAQLEAQQNAEYEVDEDDATTNNGLQNYVYGSGYVISNGTNTTTTAESNDTEADATEDTAEEAKELTAADLQEMVDAGIYDNLSDALNVTLANGYQVSDEEQAKLNLYTPEDEDKIQLMMEKYDLTREEAINSLQGNIKSPESRAQAEELKEMYDEVKDEQGWIGNLWNGFKNFFGVGLSSDDVEATIEQFENGEISYEEAQEVIESFSDKQESMTEGIKTTASVLVGGIAGLATGGIGAGLIVGAIGGAAAKTTMGLTDRATNDVKDDEWTAEVVTDALTGAAAGATASGAAKIAKGGFGLASKLAKH